MANFIYIATSLDGYIADKDGGLDWLHENPPTEGDDCGFGEFIARVDAIVMGRKTYETVLSFGQWPYTIPVFVLSNTLKIADKAEIISGSPSDIIKTLDNKGYKNLYIDGGKTIQSFLKEDLIDEMIITVIPKILGEGVPLFEKGLGPLNFKAYKTEMLSIGSAKTYYKRAYY